MISQEASEEEGRSAHAGKNGLPGAKKKPFVKYFYAFILDRQLFSACEESLSPRNSSRLVE